MMQENDEARRAVTDAWVRRYRANEDDQYVTREHIERAVGVLELIAERAWACGFDVPPPDDEGFLEQFGADVEWSHIAVHACDAAYFFRVQEICGPNPERKAPAPPGASADGDEPRWIAERSREFIGTGRLQVQIRSAGDEYCRKTARDSTTSTVEGKIPGMFKGFVDAQEQRRRERERRVEWERIRRRGEERYESDVVMRRIDDMAEQYLAMSRRREFLAALERSLEHYHGPDRDDVIRDIALLRDRVEREDPGLHPERIDLEVPPPGERELERYMDGWSASGPYRSTPQPSPSAYRPADVWCDDGYPYGTSDGVGF